MNIPDVEPQEHHRVIDLLEAAGVNVSSWNGASDPQCMEWSFIEPSRFVVLNLEWRPADTILASGNEIIYRNSMRGIATDDPKWQRRNKAKLFEKRVQVAWEYQLPIRVIFFKNSSGATTSDRQVIDVRSLDPVAWVVRSYTENGDFTLLRGGPFELPGPYVDQFAVPERYQTTGFVFRRSAIVRSTVLSIAKGKCELCKELGFAMANSKIYLETHHVKSLADEGSDSVENVAALCPNCHRKAHYSLEREKISDDLNVIISKRIDFSN